MSKDLTERTILICRGSGCNSANAQGIDIALRKLILDLNLSDSIEIKLTGCQGFCPVIAAK